MLFFCWISYSSSVLSQHIKICSCSILSHRHEELSHFFTRGLTTASAACQPKCKAICKTVHQFKKVHQIATITIGNSAFFFRFCYVQTLLQKTHLIDLAACLYAEFLLVVLSSSHLYNSQNRTYSLEAEDIQHVVVFDWYVVTYVVV